MTEIGDLLLQKGLITAQQLADAQGRRKGPADRLDRILVRLGFVDEEDVLKVWADQLSLEIVDLSEVPIDVDLLRSMPRKLVHRRGLVPIKSSDGAIRVATSDPLDFYAFDELRVVTGKKIEPVLALENDIQKVIKSHYGIGGETIDKMMSEAGETEAESITQRASEDSELELAEEASVINLVNELLTEAIRERASDVHIEPWEHSLNVRYRIDGVLQPANVPPQIQRFQAAIISRIKIMSNLNIAEKRLPQDGGMQIQYQGRSIDIRVSIIPMVWGEGVVMRILDKGTAMFTLNELGMVGDTYERFNKLIAQPHGIILVTGPTGSGKTTTLYAALAELVSDRIKVLTLEDPVEYTLEGVNQVQIQPKIGFTFARGLRSFLRHDPDVILVGEIRDLDTAEAAIQASLTGHLVFSTLHTNDACSANTRLLDMGVEPFLVSSAVEGVLAQRLVRTICPDCKTAYQPDPKQLPRDFQLSGQELYRGAGCRKCRNTGYTGRQGIFELLALDPEVRELILQRASVGKLITYARAHGMRTLREDGWLKAEQGITTVEEVVRVSKE